MESNNPFLRRITVDQEQLENYEEISGEDVRKYFFRGQTHKFSHPGAFSFIYFPVEFIAFEPDDDLNIKSVLLYLDEHETTLEALEDEFGISDLSFNREGEDGSDDSGTERLTFKSYTWIKDKFRMTFSLYPATDRHGKLSGIKSQIYILQ